METERTAVKISSAGPLCADSLCPSIIIHGIHGCDQIGVQGWRVNSSIIVNTLPLANYDRTFWEKMARPAFHGETIRYATILIRAAAALTQQLAGLRAVQFSVRKRTEFHKSP